MLYKCPNCGCFKQRLSQCPQCAYMEPDEEHGSLCMCILCIPTPKDENASDPDQAESDNGNSDPTEPSVDHESNPSGEAT